MVVITGISTETGGITIDGAAGEMVLRLPPEHTALVEPCARYDLLVTFPSRDAYRALTGVMRVDQAITANR